MPLKKFLKAHTLYSKKHIRQLLELGKVLVAGYVVIDGNFDINEFSHIVCEDKLLQQKTAYYIMLNKPIGVVSATTDKQHKTVIDCINEDYAKQLHIAGRLDLNTSGLMILTNDGKWSRNLTQPKNQIGKVYEVQTQQKVTQEYVDYFAKGLFFEYEQVQIQPAKLILIDDFNSQLTIFEGRYHQVKRMFARFDNKVVKLHRQSMGAIQLDNNLVAGAYRALTAKEIASVNT
ncbi:MAG: pseudouridine synthase [Saccharospirillaceae bacterium]|nr:pseudouridine synthase [Pseudomonadales bacterium]NRB81740.1 pseudouridine synthase [Saccharospirillaceae bacterium]